MQPNSATKLSALKSNANKQCNKAQCTKTQCNQTVQQSSVHWNTVQPNIEQHHMAGSKTAKHTFHCKAQCINFCNSLIVQCTAVNCSVGSKQWSAAHLIHLLWLKKAKFSGRLWIVRYTRSTSSFYLDWVVMQPNLFQHTLIFIIIKIITIKLWVDLSIKIHFPSWNQKFFRPSDSNSCVHQERNGLLEIQI